jgi:hypothetical protein
MLFIVRREWSESSSVCGKVSLIRSARRGFLHRLDWVINLFLFSMLPSGVKMPRIFSWVLFLLLIKLVSNVKMTRFNDNIHYYFRC